MSNPAILNFLLNVVFLVLFDHHIGINLLCRGKSLSLDDFEINGDLLPYIIQKLIRVVFINKRDIFQSGKYIVAQNAFFIGNIQSAILFSSLLFSSLLFVNNSSARNASKSPKAR